MLTFLLSLILIIGAVAFQVICKNKIKIPAVLAMIVMAVILLATSFFAVVPTGYTGILRTMGRVENHTLAAGMNIVAPWQDVVLMDNREQKIEFSQSAFSSDIQQVDIKGSVIYSINRTTAMDLYQNVGEKYADKIIVPQIAEDVKSVVSHYTAEGLIGKRTTLSSEMLTLLKEDLSAYGLNIISIAIENIDFTDAFEAAVEAKQVATQTKQRAETEQAQQTMEAQQAADRQRIKAQADADVAKIDADAKAYAIAAQAEAQAAANKRIAESLTSDLIQYTQVSNWNGQLPSTMINTDGVNVPIVTPINNKGE